MALLRMDDLLLEARRKGYAVGAFECWNSANIYAIAEGAASCGMPVIFQASPTEYGVMGGPDAMRDIVEFYVRKMDIRAALHLDHGTSIEHVKECIEAGFTSVMLDASRLPFEENVAISKQASQMAHQQDVSIEAELGHVAGCEAGLEELADAESQLTNPREAEIFVHETGIDCLAVAIGTVHGSYRSKPNINLQRLREISDIVHQPLVLHGGSGTPENILRKCISLGIAKINICTDIHNIWLEGIEEAKKSLTPSVPGLFYLPAHKMHVKMVIDKIELFKNQQ